MDIKDMHTYFRQYAQQLGMQNTRAILPEQIDILINTSITDTVNQILRENVGVTNDRVITDNSKIGQINALKPLYKVSTVNLTDTYVVTVNPEVTAAKFKLTEDDVYPGLLEGTKVVDSFMFLIDFSVNYKKAATGITINNISTVQYETGANAFTTNYFPVRLIDDAYLADTLNDFILKPSLRSPVLTIYNNSYDFYFESFIKDSSDSKYYLSNKLLPYKFRCSYIAKPQTVQYRSDVGGVNVDCDLPEYLHVDIVKHAVDLYRVAVSGSLYATQQQEQNQQREDTRNNYRNEQ